MIPKPPPGHAPVTLTPALAATAAAIQTVAAAEGHSPSNPHTRAWSHWIRCVTFSPCEVA